MELNRETYEKFLELEEMFEDKALEIISEKYRIENDRPLRYSEVGRIEYLDCSVEVPLITYSRCSCCSDETDTYEFPVEWLFDNAWKEELQEKLQRQKEAEEKAKQQKEQEQRERMEELERSQYERLKKKFE